MPNLHDISQNIHTYLFENVAFRLTFEALKNRIDYVSSGTCNTHERRVNRKRF
jgi:regulator of replication initiation timing